MNSFHAFLDIRENLGESFDTESHWKDADILRKMNTAQRKIAGMMSLAGGDWWVTSTTLTPSDSKITLPADCVKPVYLEQTTNKIPIRISGITVRDRMARRLPGTTLDQGPMEAYLEDLYLVVNKDGYSEGVTLWYEKRVPDLAFGVVATGASTALTMDSGQNPSYVDDYYNDVVVETMGTTDYEIKLRSTVSDYVAATRVMTVTGTPTTDDYYGTIPLLPIEADRLLILEATMMLAAKPSSALDPKYFEYWFAEKKHEEEEFKSWLSRRAATTSRVREVGDGYA